VASIVVFVSRLGAIVELVGEVIGVMFSVEFVDAGEVEAVVVERATEVDGG